MELHCSHFGRLFRPVPGTGGPGDVPRLLPEGGALAEDGALATRRRAADLRAGSLDRITTIDLDSLVLDVEKISDTIRSIKHAKEID